MAARVPNPKFEPSGRQYAAQQCDLQGYVSCICILLCAVNSREVVS
jgi:hypothetical protein